MYLRTSVAVLLIIVLIFQSCVAYQKTMVRMEEAENMGRSKAITVHGTKVVLKNIEYIDGAYYGENFKKQKTLLDSAQISAIYLKDVKKSKRQSLAIIGVIATPILFIGIQYLIFLLGDGHDHM